MVRHRTHSIEFKRQVVQDYLAGETLHGLASGMICCGIWSATGSRSSKRVPLTKRPSQRTLSRSTRPESERWSGRSVRQALEIEFQGE